MNLEIDRPMASLFFEIKRNMPYEDRAEMKIAAPDVGEKLVKIYQASENKALKTLIENFMDRAGGNWKRQLRSNKPSTLEFLRRVIN